jgi:prepilin-type N-terminal cleavage/methylation domain-containing protein
MKIQIKKTSGFTLIELLVVVAIISMLVGLLSVGLRKTKIASSNLRQKSVFHAMEIGLELFSKDFDGYPESRVLDSTPTAATYAGPFVCGAQHLVEALVGRDEAGIEPRTGWYAPNDALYQTDPVVNSPTFYDSTADISRNRRGGPYTELKHVDVRTIYELWQGENGSTGIYDSQNAAPAKRAPVFTDVFSKFRITLADGSTTRVGMPILYFKANRAATLQFRLNTSQQTAVNPADNLMERWTYNFIDNRAIVNLPSLADTSVTEAGHYVNPKDASKQKQQVFYELITQRSEPDRPFYKPFNANTFLLISAGWDGVYGTGDDVTNFKY